MKPEASAASKSMDKQLAKNPDISPILIGTPNLSGGGPQWGDTSHMKEVIQATYLAISWVHERIVGYMVNQIPFDLKGVFNRRTPT